MTQPQGMSSTAGGRLAGNIGTAVVSGDFVLGAGWAGGATIAVTAGSTVGRGSAVITAKTTTPAQATATVVFTFPDGAFAAAPHCFTTTTNDNSLTAATAFANTTVTTTAVTWTHSVLPVDTKLYTINWLIVA
jgi:hypothetical protein